MDFDNPKLCIGICCSAVTIVLGIVVVAFCAGTVEPIQYGLKYNTLSKNIDSSYVYEGGWYLMWPTNSFIQFPKTQVNLDFANYPNAKATPLQARSEGLQITLSFSFQYKLIKEDIPDLYKMYQQRYEENFIRIARGAVAEIASATQIDDYWNNRKQVNDKMQKFINDKFLPSYATCTGFQILRVDLPDQRERSLTTSQVAKQIGIQKEYEKSASNIRAGISVDNSDAERKITVLNGNATAEATRILNEAEAYIKDKTVRSQSEAYKKVATMTGQTPADTLMDYIYYANLYNVRNATLLVGVSSALVNMQK